MHVFAAEIYTSLRDGTLRSYIHMYLRGLVAVLATDFELRVVEDTVHQNVSRIHA
jgi:hypothetical protein